MRNVKERSARAFHEYRRTSFAASYVRQTTDQTQGGLAQNCPRANDKDARPNEHEKEGYDPIFIYWKPLSSTAGQVPMRESDSHKTGDMHFGDRDNVFDPLVYMTCSYSIFQVDAFTRRKFRGNPAGVVLAVDIQRGRAVRVEVGGEAIIAFQTEVSL